MSSSPAAPPAGAALRVRDLSHHFTVGGERRPALERISLDVYPGEFLSILGPSGCGKSTLLKLIAGLVPAQEGEIDVNGGPPPQARREKAFGVVFQDPSLLPWRTVAANVRLPLEVNRSRGGRSDVAGLLGLVGLEGFAGYYPHQLSGGMQQRAALARALATDPPILLMDEPFGALDEITRAELRYELLRISGRAGKTVLFITHSVAEAVLLSDRVAVMSPRPGRIRAVIPIDLPRPRTVEDETSQPFQEYVRRLRGLLGEDERWND